jgi:hypothetical protein
MVVKVEAAYGLSEPVGALGSRLRGLPARELEALLVRRTPRLPCLPGCQGAWGRLPGRLGRGAAACAPRAHPSRGRDAQTPDLAQAEDSPLLPLVASTLEALVELNEHKEALAMQVRGRDARARAAPPDARVSLLLHARSPCLAAVGGPWPRGCRSLGSRRGGLAPGGGQAGRGRGWGCRLPVPPSPRRVCMRRLPPQLPLPPSLPSRPHPVRRPPPLIRRRV